MSRPWSPDRVAALKGCIDAGLTAAQAAERLGLTRNACIGKANRLGLGFCSPPDVARQRAAAGLEAYWRAHWSAAR